MEPTRENLAPLLRDVDVRGRDVQITLQCPESRVMVQARHHVQPGSELAHHVKRSMGHSLRAAVASLIRSLFGHGWVGRALGDAAGALVHSTGHGPQRLSRKQVDAAVIEAFRSVQGRFWWDDERGVWTAAQAARDRMNTLERLLLERPIEHAYDQDVLARLLVHLSRCDERVSPEEQTWLTEVLGTTSIAVLAERPALSRAELQRTTRSCRPTLLTMAWVAALVDEQLVGLEPKVLSRVAQGLELGPRDVDRARSAAQEHVLDLAMERMHTWGGHDAYARDQLLELATRLGMSQSDALRAEADYRRRHS
jgi:hypothetical protein